LLAFFDRRSFSQALWLFPLAISAHMLEEALWLPGWSQQAGAWHVPVSQGEFWIASLILVVFVFGLTYGAVKGGPGGPAVYLLLCLALLMLLNIFHPHLGAAVFTGRYAPGLATALLVILPVMVYLLVRAVREGHIRGRRLAAAAVVVVPAAALIWPVLFWFGRQAMVVLRQTI
jgi:hypothetical protein